LGLAGGRLSGIRPFGCALAWCFGPSAAGFSVWWCGPRGLVCGVSKSALSCLTSTTKVANVTADPDTRCGELYASGGEVLPAGQADSEAAAEAGAGDRGSPGDWVVAAAFAASRDRFESLIGFLDGVDAAGLSHAEPEERL
jgi:hypothetical protein